MGGFLLVGLLFLQELGGGAGDIGLELDSTLAFGGHVGRRGFTEVTLRAYAGSRGGIAELYSADAAHVVVAPLDIRPGESSEHRVQQILVARVALQVHQLLVQLLEDFTRFDEEVLQYVVVEVDTHLLESETRQQLIDFVLSVDDI